MAAAGDVYEEGALIFPCVRVQRNYRDVDDVIRMCRRRIRVPDMWYGDYLAALGAARIGERGLQAFVRKYGLDTVRKFLDEWFAYSERRMMQAIRQLPRGEFTAETRHDPFPGVPDGVPLRITIKCDPDEARIVADLRDNPDCVPAGFNISEACARGAVLAGIFNTIDPTVPHNSGAFRRVEILLRDNCVAGRPQHPASCSTATTNITDRIIIMTQSAFAQRNEGWGLAEGPTGIPPTHSVIYGNDPRHEGAPYITQLLAGTAGGPASAVTDGWLSYLLPVTAGVLYRDSMEVVEQKYPFVMLESKVRPDSEGAGRFRGAPGALVAYGPVLEDMGVSYSMDGFETPPKGVRGGLDSPGSNVYRVRADGSVEELSAPVAHFTLKPGEVVGTRTTGGGGYGPPRERDPAFVLRDVRDGFVSLDRARRVYAVAIEGNPGKPETLRINEVATRRLREEISDEG
jgi:N-methylhydantoinase B